MEKKNNMQTDMDNEIPKEVTLGNTTYLHTSDEEWDYLEGINEDGIKVTLQFSKDKEKNARAMEGIKAFFSWLI